MLDKETRLRMLLMLKLVGLGLFSSTTEILEFLGYEFPD
jgi:hypothetical protein